MEVRCRLRTVKAIAEFIQERVKIEFSFPGVEAVGLELLDEVAVDVLEVMHHL